MLILKPLNIIGGNVSNFLCTQGVRLVFCQLLSYVAFGGDPQNLLKSNTDKAKIYNHIDYIYARDVQNMKSTQQVRLARLRD
jgi:hypothetical protein